MRGSSSAKWSTGWPAGASRIKVRLSGRSVWVTSSSCQVSGNAATPSGNRARIGGMWEKPSAGWTVVKSTGMLP